MEPYPELNPKRHKKHRKDKYDDRNYGGNSPYPSSVSSPGSSRLKLILKVGGSSTPEHSDSPGPQVSHVLNIAYDEDSNSTLSYSVARKKKKEKKKKKDKKHKHHKEKRRRDREASDVGPPISVIPITNETESSREESIGQEHFQVVDFQEGESAMEVEEDGEGASDSSGDVQTSSIIPTEVSHQPRVHNKVLDKVPLQRLLEHILRLLQKKDTHQVFAWPVTDKIAPGYSSIITKPMDFSTIRGKVNRLEYDSLVQFKEDFSLMCNNAMRYNHVDTLYYKAAKKLLQSGSKILDAEKVRSLLPLIPSIRVLQEEQLGFSLFVEHETPFTDNVSQSEEELNETFPLDPTKSIHYVAPHPNDPVDLCGAFTEDLTTEEVLQQARLAAREAAHRLAVKKPNSKMGFLRMREDGSTSLAILTPSNGVLPGSREQPVSLSVLTGKLSHGTTQLQGNRPEEKKNYSRAAKPLNYGSFSSFAPSHDSTFAGLTTDEQELVQATYGDDTAVQYADSIIEFAKGCDYAMRMVDEILDTLTKGEHSRTVSLIEERKKMEAEEEILRKRQAVHDESIRQEWKFVESMGLPETSTAPAGEEESFDFDSLNTLGDDLGIDTKFLQDLKPSLISTTTGKLQETATLIQNLEKLQHARLSAGTFPQHPHVQPPSENEVQLADRVTENLIQLVRQTVPEKIVSTESLQEVMGINLEAFVYQPKGSSIPGKSETVRESDSSTI